jgi:hypothetical protein
MSDVGGMRNEPIFLGYIIENKRYNRSETNPFFRYTVENKRCDRKAAKAGKNRAPANRLWRRPPEDPATLLNTTDQRTNPIFGYTEAINRAETLERHNQIPNLLPIR